MNRVVETKLSEFQLEPYSQVALKWQIQHSIQLMPILTKMITTVIVQLIVNKPIMVLPLPQQAMPYHFTSDRMFEDMVKGKSCGKEYWQRGVRSHLGYSSSCGDIIRRGLGICFLNWHLIIVILTFVTIILKLY